MESLHYSKKKCWTLKNLPKEVPRFFRPALAVSPGLNVKSRSSLIRPSGTGNLCKRETFRLEYLANTNSVKFLQETYPFCAKSASKAWNASSLAASLVAELVAILTLDFSEWFTADLSNARSYLALSNRPSPLLGQWVRLPVKWPYFDASQGVTNSTDRNKTVYYEY